eukprot:4870-Heterococcus_DN1.PRE.2
MADGYDPKKSKINDEKLAEFIRAVISGDLNEVPGLGPAALKLLAAGEGSNKVKDLEKNDPCYCVLNDRLLLKAQKYVGLQRFSSGCQHVPTHRKVPELQRRRHLRQHYPDS